MPLAPVKLNHIQRRRSRDKPAATSAPTSVSQFAAFWSPLGWERPKLFVDFVISFSTTSNITDKYDFSSFCNTANVYCNAIHCTGVGQINVKLGRKYHRREDLIITCSTRREINAVEWKWGCDIYSHKILFRGNKKILWFKFLFTFWFS